MLKVLNHTHDGNRFEIGEQTIMKDKKTTTGVFAGRISIMCNEVMIEHTPHTTSERHKPGIGEAAGDERRGISLWLW